MQHTIKCAEGQVCWFYWWWHICVEAVKHPTTTSTFQIVQVKMRFAGNSQDNIKFGNFDWVCQVWSLWNKISNETERLILLFAVQCILRNEIRGIVHQNLKYVSSVGGDVLVRLRNMNTAHISEKTCVDRKKGYVHSTRISNPINMSVYVCFVTLFLVR